MAQEGSQAAQASQGECLRPRCPRQARRGLLGGAQVEAVAGEAPGEVPPGFASPIHSPAPLGWISTTGCASGSAHRVIKNTHLKNNKNKQTRSQSDLIGQDCSEATSSYKHRQALIPSPVWGEGESPSPWRRGCYFQFWGESETLSA